jgi:hypothetical protein
MNKGKQSLDRGKNFEYRIVYKAQDKGLSAERVERSGAGKRKGDVIIEERRHENKYRSSDAGLKTLYKWFNKAIKQGCQGLIIKVKEKKEGEEDKERPCLVVLELNDYLNLLMVKNEKTNKFDS